MQLNFPLILDGRGLVGETDEKTHVNQLIEQVLFTNPGERVNRPEFGCGLLRAIFDPGDEEDLQAWQFLVQQALQRWLGDRIEIRSVTIEKQDTAMYVEIGYSELFSQEARSAAFEVVVP